MASAYFGLLKMIPERGPLKDLCVVEVTTSQYSNGLFYNLAATRPEMCAMSAMRIAPQLSAISRYLA